MNNLINCSYFPGVVSFFLGGCKTGVKRLSSLQRINQAGCYLPLINSGPGHFSQCDLCRARFRNTASHFLTKRCCNRRGVFVRINFSASRFYLPVRRSTAGGEWKPGPEGKAAARPSCWWQKKRRETSRCLYLMKFTAIRPSVRQVYKNTARVLQHLDQCL